MASSQWLPGFGPIQDPQLLYATNYPKGAVEIIDSGNSERLTGWATPGDMRTNHVWLLHQVQSSVNQDSDWIGVYDPEDIQPLSKKSEISKLLSALPELDTLNLDEIEQVKQRLHLLTGDMTVSQALEALGLSRYRFSMLGASSGQTAKAASSSCGTAIS